MGAQGRGRKGTGAAESALTVAHSAATSSSARLCEDRELSGYSVLHVQVRVRDGVGAPELARAVARSPSSFNVRLRRLLLA